MPANVTNTTNDIAHQFHAAYVATAADRAALAPSDLLPVNLDVQVAVTTVLGAMPKANTLRADVAAKLPAEILSHFDKAETYARALAYANTVHLAASEPTEVLPELAERAMKFRELLLTDAKALAHRGLIDGKPLGELKGAPGYMNIASDLGVLVRMLRERWTTIASKCAIQSSEIDEAEQIYEQITVAYAERNRQSLESADAAEDRQRAFTLLLTSYDQVRRAAAFVRWDTDDQEKFAPSLWTGRGGRGRQSDLPRKPEVPAPTAAASAPVQAVPEATPTAPMGLPGSSPFAQS
jgi:hypothetical protein